MSSSDLKLHYTETGQGAPVLLLDWTPWESLTLMDGLAEGYRVISVDPPDGSTGPVSAGDAVAAAAAVAEGMRLESYTLVGASLGAGVAFQLALQNPGRVSSLILISPTIAGSAGNHQWETPELAAATMLAHPELDGLELPEAARTTSLASLAREWAAAGDEDTDSLPDLLCATLVVYGQEDRLVSRTAGHTWKERAPNCSVCYVYDAGHAIAVDRPEALLNVVLDFVARRETFIVESRSGLINP